jgi:hypothetical protein
MPRGNTQNLSRGRVDQRPREGRVQRLCRRLLIAQNGPITTRELVEQAWPGERKLWHWVNAARVIERFAYRAGPRSRPLTWVAKPNVLGTDITSASDETKSDT